MATTIHTFYIYRIIIVMYRQNCIKGHVSYMHIPTLAFKLEIKTSVNLH